MLQVLCSTQACTLHSLPSVCGRCQPQMPCTVHPALLSSCHSLPAAPPAAAACLCSSQELCATHVTVTVLGVPLPCLQRLQLLLQDMDPLLPSLQLGLLVLQDVCLQQVIPFCYEAVPATSADCPCALPAAAARDEQPGVLLELQRPIGRYTVRHATPLGAVPIPYSQGDVLVQHRLQHQHTAGSSLGVDPMAAWVSAGRPGSACAACCMLLCYGWSCITAHIGCGRLGQPAFQSLWQCLFWVPLSETSL